MNEKNTIECLDLYQGRGQDEMSQGMYFYNTDLISCKYNNLNVLDSAKKICCANFMDDTCVDKQFYVVSSQRIK